MYELSCPSCNTTSQFNTADNLLMCSYCSATFHVDSETGRKEIYPNHYIVPNLLDPAAVKNLALEWLKRMHHKPSAVEHEFFITKAQGLSIPYWIISFEGHTVWKGLVRKYRKASVEKVSVSGDDYLLEKGQFRRSYRWAVSARPNICETWGVARLHEPQENIRVEWDGFPLDSTLSRGQMISEDIKSAYDARKFFEFKFANGLPILGVQVDEEEALRRAKSHVHLFHYKLGRLNTDYLLDYRTELEIAGIQLVHLPFWSIEYLYRPKGLVRHFVRSKEKHLLISGYDKGILGGELALEYNDKVVLNSIICGFSAIVLFVCGVVWHPAFYFAALFSIAIAAISLLLSSVRKTTENDTVAIPGVRSDFAAQ